MYIEVRRCRRNGLIIFWLLVVVYLVAASLLRNSIPAHISLQRSMNEVLAAAERRIAFIIR